MTSYRPKTTPLLSPRDRAPALHSVNPPPSSLKTSLSATISVARKCAHKKKKYLSVHLTDMNLKPAMDGFKSRSTRGQIAVNILPPELRDFQSDFFCIRFSNLLTESFKQYTWKAINFFFSF